MKKTLFCLLILTVISLAAGKDNMPAPYDYGCWQPPKSNSGTYNFDTITANVAALDTIGMAGHKTISDDDSTRFNHQVLIGGTIIKSNGSILIPPADTVFTNSIQPASGNTITIGGGGNVVSAPNFQGNIITASIGNNGSSSNMNFRQNYAGGYGFNFAWGTGAKGNFSITDRNHVTNVAENKTFFQGQDSTGMVRWQLGAHGTLMIRDTTATGGDSVTIFYDAAGVLHIKTDSSSGNADTVSIHGHLKTSGDVIVNGAVKRTTAFMLPFAPQSSIPLNKNSNTNVYDNLYSPMADSFVCDSLIMMIYSFADSEEIDSIAMISQSSTSSYEQVAKWATGLNVTIGGNGIYVRKAWSVNTTFGVQNLWRLYLAGLKMHANNAIYFGSFNWKGHLK